MSVWSSTVDGLHTPYVFPQENGNRHQTKWASFTEESGKGLFISGSTFDFTASYYTVEQLEVAKHTSDLFKQPYITLHVDKQQYGLGSASCGQEVQEHIAWKTKTLNLHFRCYHMMKMPIHLLL